MSNNVSPKHQASRPKCHALIAITLVGMALCIASWHIASLDKIPDLASSNKASAASDSGLVVSSFANVPSRRKLSSEELLFPSKVGPIASSTSLWKNDFNLVHVVNTRFMQHQGNLVDLGEARLDLFKTFTLPSMLSQSNQQFLWLIWTDAKLDKAVQTDLISSVADIHNVVVIGSEQVQDTDFRSAYGHSWSSLSSAVLSGHHKLMADCYAAAQDHVVVETSLDSDDALSSTFVESAQELAAASIGQNVNGVGRMEEVFCPDQHVEWRYYKPQDINNAQGHLVHYNNKKFCINSGLTHVHHPHRESDVSRELTATTRVYQCGIATETPECPEVEPTRRVLSTPAWANTLPTNLAADTSKCTKAVPAVPIGTEIVTPYENAFSLHCTIGDFGCHSGIDFVQLPKYLAVATAHKDGTVAFNAADSFLGANAIVLSRADPNLDNVFLNNAGSNWVDVDNTANSGEDYLPGAARVHEAVTWTGDVALTSSCGEFKNSNTALYGQTGATFYSTSTCDSNSQQSNSRFVPQGVGDGVTKNPSGSSNLSTKLITGQSTAMNVLRQELHELYNFVTQTLQREQYYSSGFNNDFEETNLDAADTNNDGIAVIDLDCDGGPFQVTNTNWIIESEKGTFGVFRLIGDQGLDLSQSTIMSGDGILGNKGSGGMPADVPVVFRAIFVNGQTYDNGGTGTFPGSAIDYGTTFNFNNVVLNGVGFYDLTQFQASNGGLNDGGKNVLNVQNGQGCAQFVGPSILYSNCRFDRCAPSGGGQSSKSNCPAQSTMCVGADSGETILPSYIGENNAAGNSPVGELFFVRCIPIECTTDVVHMLVEVKDARWSSSGSKWEILDYLVFVYGSEQGSPDLDYKMMEGFSKSEGGGLAYTWVDDNGDPAGVYSDLFETLTDSGSTQEALEFGDFCVIPEDPSNLPCLRKLSALPDRHRRTQETPMTNRIQASVLMARTPTAAGMKHVLPKKKSSSNADTNSVQMDTFESSQEEAWTMMKQDFGVNKTAVVRLRERFEGKMERILLDNFNGQCTPGHSCKESTKKALGYLLENVYRRQSA